MNSHIQSYCISQVRQFERETVLRVREGHLGKSS